MYLYQFRARQCLLDLLPCRAHTDPDFQARLTWRHLLRFPRRSEKWKIFKIFKLRKIISFLFKFVNYTIFTDFKWAGNENKWNPQYKLKCLRFYSIHLIKFSFAIIRILRKLCVIFLRVWQGFYFELDSAARGHFTTDSRNLNMAKHSVIVLLPT